MLGRTTSILIAVFVFLALTAPAATADQNIPLPQTEEFLYKDKQRPVIIHLLVINTTDKPLSNVFPPENSQNLKWVRLFYSYENTGDSQVKAFIKVIFVDSNGNQYQNDNDEYTGESVLPHTITDPMFIEVPVPKNAEITQFIIRQGFYETVYQIPRVTATPTPSLQITPTAAGTPTTDAGNRGFDGCLPFIPFAMAGGLAAAGMVINRGGFRRR
ncbi:hypothetical protein [Methanocella arvoryzae]|uniref:Uncharacterized protein n=1 Tax=Methanocella arvoryzae (strain DSM 22066 / NBRC 105507 / MRE50) TaxID=351160 RepID=Q0W8W3_METAR|nr:hypothetical protein [Methanocella arvoryzae]CAJ35180.1 hypothetical protein LRC175 [Methanocella arvoryzae MRE50]